MDKIAFILENTFLYWNSIILMLAAAAAICMFLFLYLRERNTATAASVLIPLAVILSILISRLIHWYCRADAYESLKAALTVYTGGSYALMGVFAGCILAACILRLLGVVKNLPFTFDCMSLAGALGISVGRLASLYTTADRGPLVENLRLFPIVYPVSNAVTGVVEWRLATFMLQSICTGAIFLALIVFYMKGQKGKTRKVKDGDTTMLFLSSYCASQVVLDSTRYDSLFMRSNGFISIVQILCAVALVVNMIIFSVRLVKNKGFKWAYLGLWIPFAAMTGGAGFMEYWVQRHGDQALFSYSVMSICLVGLVVLTCVTRKQAGAFPTRKNMVENAKK